MAQSLPVSKPNFQIDHHPLPRMSTMELDTLKELYIDGLKDLYSAENQILKALPRMIKASSHKQLKTAFATHERQTREHAKRLERVCKELGVSPKGKKCHGMEGLLEEGKELISEKPDPDVLDAGLISAAQHVEHYEIAGYGTVRTYAHQLGYESQMQLLQRTLDEEGETDQLLTSIAVSSINLEAGDGEGGNG
jgi:ferritin-like metal-binding protein YciE